MLRRFRVAGVRVRGCLSGYRFFCVYMFDCKFLSVYVPNA